jgi:hypothetical protein
MKKNYLLILTILQICISCNLINFEKHRIKIYGIQSIYQNNFYFGLKGDSLKNYLNFYDKKVYAIFFSNNIDSLKNLPFNDYPIIANFIVKKSKIYFKYYLNEVTFINGVERIRKYENSYESTFVSRDSIGFYFRNKWIDNDSLFLDTVLVYYRLK